MNCCRLKFTLVTATLLVATGSTSAQQQQPGSNSFPEMPSPQFVPQDMPSAQVNTWTEVSREASKDDVSEILNTSGWSDSLEALKTLPAGESSEYTVYMHSAVPGVSDFLVVPNNSDDATPLEFKSPASYMVPAGYDPRDWFPTKQEVRDELAAGMQAAIESLCNMPARPKEITARASAAGVVEVEALWVSSEVCSVP